MNTIPIIVKLSIKRKPKYRPPSEYTGWYFGRYFYKCIYKPTRKYVRQLKNTFDFPFYKNEKVLVKTHYKKPPRRGIIEECAYTTEGSIGRQPKGGAIIRIYYIAGKWYYESELIKLVHV